MAFPPYRDRSRPLRLTGPVPVPAPVDPSTESAKQAEAVENLRRGLVAWLIRNTSPRTRAIVLTLLAFGGGWVARQLPIVARAIGLQTIEQAAIDKKDLDDKISAAVSKQQTGEHVEAEKWKQIEATLATVQKANTENLAKIEALNRKLSKRPAAHPPKEPSERAE